jgi:hypothetical protein
VDITSLCTIDGSGLNECPSDRHCGLPGEYELFNFRFKEEAEIEELDWGIPNFDHIGSALFTVFQTITLEGWNKLMYNHYGATSPYFLSLYFSIVVLLGAFFVLNLMLAAIWTTFTKESEKEGTKHTN